MYYTLHTYIYRLKRGGQFPNKTNTLQSDGTTVIVLKRRHIVQYNNILQINQSILSTILQWVDKVGVIV